MTDQERKIMSGLTGFSDPTKTVGYDSAEDIYSRAEKLAAEINRLQLQRDNLLTACRAFVRLGGHTACDCEACASLKLAVAAIAAVAQPVGSEANP